MHLNLNLNAIVNKIRNTSIMNNNVS